MNAHLSIEPDEQNRFTLLQWLTSQDRLSYRDNPSHLPIQSTPTPTYGEKEGNGENNHEERLFPATSNHLREHPLKHCIERLFRHCQDQSSTIRKYCIDQLGQLGVDLVLSALGWDGFVHGMRGVVCGVREEVEGEVGRWIMRCLRKMIAYEMEKREWNEFRVTREELHQVIIDVVCTISKGNDLDVWKRLFTKHYVLLLCSSTNE